MEKIFDAGVSLIELRKSVGMVFQHPNPAYLRLRKRSSLDWCIVEHASRKPTLDDSVEGIDRSRPLEPI
jgi:ABC-type phosphate transport system ATPase subunit